MPWRLPCGATLFARLLQGPCDASAPVTSRRLAQPTILAAVHARSVTVDRMHEPRGRRRRAESGAGLSLFLRLSELPGEKGVAVDLERDYFAVELVEFPKKPADLERVIAAVRSWLGEVRLPMVTVESRWHLTARSASGGAEKPQRVLTWKFEDGPAAAPEEGSADDVGPAWLDTPDSGRRKRACGRR